MSDPVKATLIAPSQKWLVFVEHEDGSVNVATGLNSYSARLIAINFGLPGDKIRVVDKSSWARVGSKLLQHAWQLLVRELSEPKEDPAPVPSKSKNG